MAICTAGRGHFPDEGDVRSQVSDRLARFKQPKAIIQVDALPRNTMGKVQKNLLREQYAHWFTDSEDHRGTA